MTDPALRPAARAGDVLPLKDLARRIGVDPSIAAGVVSQVEERGARVQQTRRNYRSDGPPDAGSIRAGA